MPKLKRRKQLAVQQQQVDCEILSPPRVLSIKDIPRALNELGTRVRALGTAAAYASKPQDPDYVDTFELMGMDLCATLDALAITLQTGELPRFRFLYPGDRSEVLVRLGETILRESDDKGLRTDDASSLFSAACTLARVGEQRTPQRAPEEDALHDQLALLVRQHGAGAVRAAMLNEGA